MKTIDLSEYSPIISDRRIGEEIYTKIKGYLETEEQVSLDLSKIKSMATFCAKQIFGNLYIDLGPSDFFERIILLNASNDLKTIIMVGIQNAIQP